AEDRPRRRSEPDHGRQGPRGGRCEGARMNDPIIVKSFTDKGEAEIAKGLLEAEGIDAAIAADDLGSEGPGLTFGRPIDLVVAAADAERAAELLDQVAEGAAEGDEEADS